MKPLPLRLALEPVLPARTPADDDAFEYGFRLRLPRGPALRRDDPLLTAFGAGVDWVSAHEDCDGEALQSDAFDPGHPLRLVPDQFDPDDPNAIGVYDVEGLRQAGALSEEAAAIVAAGIQAGLQYEGLALWERRAASDDRREELNLLVYSPSFVRVRVPPNLAIQRPTRPARPRLVLVADASGTVRWWDPAATAGPLDATDLPLSQELREELDRLRHGFAELDGDDDDESASGFDRMESRWEREMLNSTAAALWRRARAELGRRYAVGFLGEGMRRPVWSPSELEAAYGEEFGPGADIPF